MIQVKYNPEQLRFEGYANGRWESITKGISADAEDHNPLVRPVDRYRLEVSLTCNLRCRYCVVHMNNVSQQNTVMSLETANEIISRFNSEVGSTGSIFLMGGEPLVNTSVVKYIVENAAGSSIIFTNALALTDELIDFFYTHGTYILTSLDGYTIEQNEKRFWPNVEKNYARVTENIKKAIQRGCKVGVSCLLHKDNVNDALAIASFFVDDLKARAMSFSYPHLTVDDSEENEFDFSVYAEQMKKLYLFSKEHQVYIDQIGKIISSIQYGFPAVLGCKSGTTQRTFYPNGQETICTKIDTVSSVDMGVYCADLPFYSQTCENCVARTLCSGECPWDYTVARLGGKTHERVCAYKKSVISFIVDDICTELSRADTCEEARQLFEYIFAPMTNNYSR